MFRVPFCFVVLLSLSFPAPQKVMWLWESAWREGGLRDKIHVRSVRASMRACRCSFSLLFSPSLACPRGSANVREGLFSCIEFSCLLLCGPGLPSPALSCAEHNTKNKRFAVLLLFLREEGREGRGEVRSWREWGVGVSGRGEGGWQVNLTWPDVLYPLLYAPSFFTNLPSMFAVKKYGDVLDKMAQGKRECVWEGGRERERTGGREGEMSERFGAGLFHTTPAPILSACEFVLR